jgi:glycosyltransferase involved in cell wall biosynthesis
MKELMQILQNVFDLKGGNTMQMVKTKGALKARRVDVELSLDLRSNVPGYYVVRLFSLTRVQEQETFVQTRSARAGKPVVLSTIYWYTEEFERNAAVGLRGFPSRHLSIDAMERLKAAGKFVLRGERGEGARHLITHSYRQMQRDILDTCDVFLPKAEAEMDQIETHLDFSSENYVVVPNAVDTESIRAARADGSSKYEKYKGWLVCIGRIDIRKNQMNLIRALDGSDYKIVFVGKKSTGHRGYGDEVVRAIQANPNMEWIERIPNEDVYKLCRACKVSVLPSWFETPGLVSPEAAAMGCNIVVSPEGTTRDYFGGSDYYCDVSDLASIRAAIDEAYAAPMTKLSARRCSARTPGSVRPRRPWKATRWRWG